ncbi:MAG TPA: hypothetical protein PL001_04135 [Candidatus Kryptobacter bacterium]|nr:hypothetical protein [Candidatus Kryptobacter bacterium]
MPPFSLNVSPHHAVPTLSGLSEHLVYTNAEKPATAKLVVVVRLSCAGPANSMHLY